MSAELVRLATRENLNEPDWSKNIEVCEVASRDPVEAKIVIKAIKKRLGCKDPNSQVFSVVLLEMLMNNCGEHIHRMVVETGLLQLMVKIVKKKIDSPVREKLFLLLDATQTALGGASGKFPQYYKAYHELVRARVQFQDQSAVTSNPSDSSAEAENLPVVSTVPQKPDVDADPPNPDSVPDSSIIEKATTVMEVLREVLYAVDPLHPEGATNEFTLDLMEQCSFEKQRVMHLVMTSCDDQLVSQAIELNEQLQQLLTKHDQLLSFPNSSSTAVRHDNQPISAPKSSSTAVSHDNQLLSAPNSSSTAVNHEDQFPSAPNSSSVAVNHEETEDEEEADCLLQRDRKGKACAQAWREDPSESSSNSSDSFILENLPPPPPPPFWSSLRETQEPEPIQAAPVIPPPPAKSKERDLFFKEKETATPGKIGEKLGGLSLRRRNGNGSQSGSMKFNE